jgi:hypothetical protein
MRKEKGEIFIFFVESLNRGILRVSESNDKRELRKKTYPKRAVLREAG